MRGSRCVAATLATVGIGLFAGACGEDRTGPDGMVPSEPASVDAPALAVYGAGDVGRAADAVKVLPRIGAGAGRGFVVVLG